MTLEEKGFRVLQPADLHWRESNRMRLPNTDLGVQLGATRMGARLWWLPPKSASTWHKEPVQEEIYYLVSGRGRMRIGDETITLQSGGVVRVDPPLLRQVFNDTDEEALWLVFGAPLHEKRPPDEYYPEDETQLPPELAR